jgi:cytochrome c-type biogenesis protein
MPLIRVAATSFFLGLLTSTSPCILPLFPGYLAYLSGQEGIRAGKGQYFLGFFVLAGVLTTMLLVGGLIALLAVPIGRVLRYVIPLSDCVIFLLGVLLLADRNPFKAIPQIPVPILRHPYLNAFLYGVLYGPITLPCSGALVVSIFALSLTIGEALNKFWLFLWFGIGFGAPLLILSFLSGSFQRRLTILFARHNRLINRIGGFLLIGIALYDLAKNWAMLRLSFS